MDKASRDRLTAHDPELLVTKPFPDRSAELPDPPPSVYGCAAQKRNICRTTLGHVEGDMLDNLTKRLSSWVDSLTPATAVMSESLVWLRGRGEPGSGNDHDMVALLIDARYRPKAQIFGMCVLEHGVGMADEVFAMPSFPCLLKLSSGPSRISHVFDSIRCVTSDELALRMLRLGGEWSIAPLVWAMPADKHSLMFMRVDAAGPVFERAPHVRARPKVRPAPELGILEQLDLPAPHEANRFANMPINENAPPHDTAEETANLRQAGFSEKLHLPSDLADFLDEAGLDGLPRDVLADVVQAFECEAGLGGDSEDEAPEEPAQEQEQALSAESGGEEEALKAADAQGAQESADRAPPSLEQLVEACTVTALGYVSCPLPPWDSRPVFGRITTWPTNKPVASRSVSCRCYTHTGCTTPAKRRWQVSDRQLLEWLLQGRVEPEAGSDRRKALAAEHRAAFAQISNPPPSASSGDQAPGREGAASSSGGAA